MSNISNSAKLHIVYIIHTYYSEPCASHAYTYDTVVTVYCGTRLNLVPQYTVTTVL